MRGAVIELYALKVYSIDCVNDIIVVGDGTCVRLAIDTVAVTLTE